MIGVHLTAMTGHGLGHSPDIAAPRPEEVIPEPHRRGQFRIIPRKTAHIITPRLPFVVVGMHDVAIVPEAIPLVILDIALIVRYILRQPLLYRV